MKTAIAFLLALLAISEPVKADPLDIVTLARVMHCEAHGEGRGGMIAVADVVLNRVESDRYPDNIYGVVHQKHQFECITKGRRGSLRDHAYQQVVLLAQDVLAGRTPRMTTATHYHADYITPYWAASLPKLGRIGNHIFYAERN